MESLHYVDRNTASRGIAQSRVEAMYRATHGWHVSHACRFLQVRRCGGVARGPAPSIQTTLDQPEFSCGWGSPMPDSQRQIRTPPAEFRLSDTTSRFNLAGNGTIGDRCEKGPPEERPLNRNRSGLEAPREEPISSANDPGLGPQVGGFPGRRLLPHRRGRTQTQCGEFARTFCLRGG